MSKELEALENIGFEPLYQNEDGSYWRVRDENKEDFDIIEKELKALEIIKECLVSEFKLFEKEGEYFILFYFDEIHELLFKLRNQEEYDLLKEVLL